MVRNKEVTSCDLKRLRIANDGQFVFLPLSDRHSIGWDSLGGKRCSFLFLTYCVSYTNKLYMIIIFSNSFIFDAILLRY